ncbi:MAG: NAD-dependent epimerase/dehydratase family protein [Pseudomonadota bacterium]
MRILICGASGFIGRHLCKALSEAGHDVVRGVRKPLDAGEIGMDYRLDTQAETWLPRLADVEAVINAVGVLRDTPDTPMDPIHSNAPQALFSACATVGIKQVVHISALGVGSSMRNRYFSTRQEAEKHLRSLSPRLKALILRPSLIYGEDGASARLFRTLAALPLHPLPSGGGQVLRPVHIDDIAEAVARWLDDPTATTLTVAAVGHEETTLRGMLDSYRSQQDRPPARRLSIPRALMRIAARLGDHFPSSLLCSETLDMLEAGNTADDGEFSRLLGRPPRAYRDFLQTPKA